MGVPANVYSIPPAAYFFWDRLLGLLHPNVRPLVPHPALLKEKFLFIFVHNTNPRSSPNCATSPQSLVIA